MVVPRDEEESFEYDPEEDVNIEQEKDGDSDESDEDYVPEGGAGGSGESDGDRDEIPRGRQSVTRDSVLPETHAVPHQKTSLLSVIHTECTFLKLAF